MGSDKPDGTVAIPRMIPNPEYLASREHQWEIDNFKDALAVSRECVEDYFPENYGNSKGKVTYER